MNAARPFNAHSTLPVALMRILTLSGPRLWRPAVALALAALVVSGCDDDERRGPLDIPSGDLGQDTRDASTEPDTPLDTAPDGEEEETRDGDTADTGADALDTEGDGESVEPDTVEPGVRERSCVTEIVWDGAPGATQIHVAGEFNGWTPEITPMTRGTDGLWRVGVDLPAGSYAYKFVIDGFYEESLPSDIYTQWDGGIENRSLRVGDCTRPMFEAVSLEVSDEGVIRGTLQMIRAEGGAPLDPQSLVLTLGEQVVTPDVVDVESGRVEFAWSAPRYGKYSLRLRAADAEGRRIEHEPFYVPLWYEAQDFTWQDATLYLIFTDRFRDTDGLDWRIEGVAEKANYLGGDFRGITRAIEEGYFEQMGVNALWLSPVYDNPDHGYPDKRDPSKSMSGFHGYWPVSLEPEPRYADADEPDPAVRLRELVDTAHAHGIRVIFDLALNHVHESHPYCQEDPSWCSSTCLCGSSGCGWDPSERGIDCQFDDFLPDLSYRNHDIVERVIADTLAMAEAYDLDGMRIDAARHMDHVIMRTLRLTLRDRIESQGGAPYYLVGETFTDDRGQIMDYVSHSELHGQFDFAMRSAIRWVFGPGNGSFRDLDAAAAASESPDGYGEFVWWMSPFFGNHDIDRFATVLAQNDQGPWGESPDLMALGPADTIDQWDIINRMTLAFAWLLTYKGIPLLYYGDEIGLAGSQDPDNRRMMMWDLNANQRELLGRVRKLGQARRELGALRHGERRELWQNETFYVYARYGHGHATVIVAMNKGAQRTEQVTLPPELGLTDGRVLTSYNSTRQLTVSGGQVTVTLDPWEYAIFH